jgi:hypothetical protein
MWTRADFDTLKGKVPFSVLVDWETRPSAQKYGHVNSLLAVICTFHVQGAAFTDSDGKAIDALEISSVKRKLTDKHKKNFALVGHATAIPLLTFILDHLIVDVYFNHHFMTETETTYRQYFPSASVILRPRNFLKGNLIRSPGSWGSDIIWMTHDWTGTFILETVELGLTGRARRNFRGYKLVPVQDKLLISRRRPSGIDRKLLSNNGFTNLIVGNNLDACLPALSREVVRYIRDQRDRLVSGDRGPSAPAQP